MTLATAGWWSAGFSLGEFDFVQHAQDPGVVRLQSLGRERLVQRHRSPLEIASLDVQPDRLKFFLLFPFLLPSLNFHLSGTQELTHRRVGSKSDERLLR
jgi:hypothetical protein